MKKSGWLWLAIGLFVGGASALIAANEVVWKVGDSAYVDAEGDATFTSISGSGALLTGVVGGGSPLVSTASGTSTAVFIGADAATPADTLFDTTGAGTITVGSADVTATTLTTDGTGDAEVVLPDDSIGDAEIAFDEVTGADLTLTDCTAITASGAVIANGTTTLGNATNDNITITGWVTSGVNFRGALTATGLQNGDTNGLITGSLYITGGVVTVYGY